MENTMKSAFLKKLNDLVEIEQLPIPSPKENEILVKLLGSTINPSDELFLKGHYFSMQLPSSLGFEGFGIVSAVGSESNKSLIGKKVSFWSVAARSWAEYTTVPLQDVMVMPDDTEKETGTFAYLNPITCYGLLALAKEGNHKGVIITAAASQCGRILTRLCKQAGIKTLCTIRKDEHKSICLDNGADVVLNTTDNDFEDKLKYSSAELSATLCADCIGGSFAAKVLELMPFKSKLYLYGFLSGEPIIPVSATALFAGDKTLGVYFIPNFVQSLDEKAKEEVHNYIINTLRSQSRTEISRVFPLEEINEALKYYEQNASRGKVLITF
jgi:NADPH2:quinone reductase